jgi:hypothetical protein
MIELTLLAVIKSAWNMLCSFCLQWWQHTIVIALHERCKTAEVIGCRIATVIPRVRYVHQILPFPSKCAEDYFRLKLRLQWHSIGPNSICLDVFVYTHQRLLFLMASSLWHFAPYSLFYSVAVANIEGHRKCVDNRAFITSNILYWEVL